jgi:hypothetical protein
MARGINLKIDTTALVKFANRAAMVAKITNPLLAIGVNTVGDGVVALVATQLQQRTGLALEQVRGMIKVRRASRGSLKYEVVIDQRLMQEKVDTLAGQREIKEFGKRQPGEMVIIQSAKDELVCMDCEELAAAGPMPIEIAMQHVPKHPNCRCIIMPYNQPGKRLPVRMTTLSGTDPKRRMGGQLRTPLETDVTLRQLAQNVINSAGGKMKIGLRR